MPAEQWTTGEAGVPSQEDVPPQGPVGAQDDAPPKDDVARQLALVLGRLIRVLRREAPTDLGPGSMAALATLARSGPLRLGDLAAREGVSPPTLTRMVAALEDAGYLRRRPDEADRRAVLVSVTESGAAVVTRAEAARAAVLRGRLAGLPAADLEALVAALPAIEKLAIDPD